MTLIEKSARELLEEFASKKAAPGGGSAAALAGSIATALVAMVAKLTGAEAIEILREAETIRTRLTQLVDEDCTAFNLFVKAPPSGKQDALKHAALVPMETAELSYRVLHLADVMVKNGNENAITDAGVATLLANTAVQGAELNVKINLSLIKDVSFKADVEKRLQKLANADVQCRQTLRYVREKLK